MGFLRKVTKSIKKVIKPVAAIGAAVYTGNPSLLALGFSGGGGGQPVEIQPAVPSSNTAGWLDGALNLYFKERDLKRTVEENKRDREAIERERVQGFDFAIRREELARTQGQSGNNFNPAPGFLSNFPFADNAENKQRGGMSGSAVPGWLIPVVVGIAALFILPALIKR